MVQPLPLVQSQRPILHRRRLHEADGEARHRRRRGVDELEGQLVLAQGHQHEDQACLCLQVSVAQAVTHTGSRQNKRRQRRIQKNVENVEKIKKSQML